MLYFSYATPGLTGGSNPTSRAAIISSFYGKGSLGGGDEEKATRREVFGSDCVAGRFS